MVHKILWRTLSYIVHHTEFIRCTNKPFTSTTVEELIHSFAHHPLFQHSPFLLQLSPYPSRPTYFPTCVFFWNAPLHLISRYQASPLPTLLVFRRFSFDENMITREIVTTARDVSSEEEDVSLEHVSLRAGAQGRPLSRLNRSSPISSRLAEFWTPSKLHVSASVSAAATHLRIVLRHWMKYYHLRIVHPV